MAFQSRRRKLNLSQLQPTLSEAIVQELATTKSYDRGQQYYRSGAITCPTRQDNRIWAECEGSEIYQVSATLTSSDIKEMHCSCPYDWGGICKHQVALLLTYIHQPDDFHVIRPLNEMLANHSREDLINFIDRILQQHPDLLNSL